LENTELLLVLALSLFHRLYVVEIRLVVYPEQPMCPVKKASQHETPEANETAARDVGDLLLNVGSVRGAVPTQQDEEDTQWRENRTGENLPRVADRCVSYPGPKLSATLTTRIHISCSRPGDPV
jgi:hypothetical protein